MKVKNEKTSERVATYAGLLVQELGDFVYPEKGRIYAETVNGNVMVLSVNVAELKALAGSALTQTDDHPKTHTRIRSSKRSRNK